MEPEYLDEKDTFDMALIYKNAFANIKISKDIEVKKRGGLNEITFLREETAKLLTIPKEQVFGITRGWSKNTLRDLLKTCNNFINPPALWWKIYNEKKDTYRRNNKKILLRNGKDWRKKHKGKNGQKSLF